MGSSTTWWRRGGIVILDAGIIHFDAEGHPTFEPGGHDFETEAFEELQCELLA